MNWIVTGDWHLREDVPVCRGETPEEWLALQMNSVRFLVDEARRLQARLMVNGDIFHRPYPYPATKKDDATLILVNSLIPILQSYNEVYITYGNHDVPQRFTEHTASNYGNLLEAGIKTIGAVAAFVPYGQEVPAGKVKTGPLFLHQLVFADESVMPPGNHGGITAHDLIEKYPNFDYFVTSDNHSSFLCQEKDRPGKWQKVVMNPGCLVRQSVKHREPSPAYFVITSDAWDSPEACCNPFDADIDMVSNTHRLAAKSKEARGEACVKALESIESISLDYELTVMNELGISGLSDKAKEFIKKLFEGGRG